MERKQSQTSSASTPGSSLASSFSGLDNSSSSDPISIVGDFGNYELKVPGDSKTALTAGSAVSEKVDEVLRSRLKGGDADEKKLAAAKKALYKGTEKETWNGSPPPPAPSMAARQAYKDLLEKYLSEGQFKLCTAERHIDGSYVDRTQAAVSIKDLCQDPKKGKELLDRYKAAIAEEKNSSAFREAVLLSSLHVEEGPAWVKRLVLWIAGPSASGKSYATKKAVLEMMQHLGHISEDKVKNYLLLIDGGIERDVSQVRKMMLGVSLQYDYSGLDDLHKNSKMDIKSILKEVGDIIGMHMGIPETFANPLENPMADIKHYAKEEDTIIGMANICGPDAEMADLCEAQGTRRALLNAPLEREKKDKGICLNGENPCESKEYEGGVNRAVGQANSGNTVSMLIKEFEDTKGKAFVIEMYTKPIFVMVNEKGKLEKVDGRSSDHIRIEKDDFNKIDEMLEKKRAEIESQGEVFTIKMAEDSVKRWLKNHEKVLEAKDVSEITDAKPPVSHAMSSIAAAWKYKRTRTSSTSSEDSMSDFSPLNIKPIERLKKEVLGLLDEAEKLKEKPEELKERIQSLEGNLDEMRKQYADDMSSVFRRHTAKELIDSTQTLLKYYSEAAICLQENNSIKDAIAEAVNNRNTEMKKILTEHEKKHQLAQAKSTPIPTPTDVEIRIKVSSNISSLYRGPMVEQGVEIKLNSKNVKALFESIDNVTKLAKESEKLGRLIIKFLDSGKWSEEEVKVRLVKFMQLYQEIEKNSPNSSALVPLAKVIVQVLDHVFSGPQKRWQKAAFLMTNKGLSIEKNMNKGLEITTSAEERRQAAVQSSELSFSLKNAYPDEVHVMRIPAITASTETDPAPQVSTTPVRSRPFARFITSTAPSVPSQEGTSDATRKRALSSSEETSTDPNTSSTDPDTSSTMSNKKKIKGHPFS